MPRLHPVSSQITTSRSSTMLLPDRPMPWSDEPVFPLGPMKISQDDDVLCMVCVSARYVMTVENSLADLIRLVSMQGARAWVQLYDTVRRGDIQEVDPQRNLYPIITSYHGGQDLASCLSSTLEALPLANGRRPTQVIVACDGLGQAQAPLPAPVLDGKVLPAMVMLPSYTSDHDARQWCDMWTSVDGAMPMVWFGETMLRALEIEAEQANLRQALHEQDPSPTMNAAVVTRGRPRL